MQFQWELKPGVWVDYEEEENDSLVVSEKREDVRLRLLFISGETEMSSLPTVKLIEVVPPKSCR